MQNLLKQVPGFRSDTKWKKIISGLFYLAFIFAIITEGLEGFLVTGGAILLGVSIIDLVKNKKSKVSLKAPIFLLLAGLILISTGTQIASQNAIASKETEQLVLITEENEELKTKINTLKEKKERLKSKNSDLVKENKKFLTAEKKVKDEAEEKARRKEKEEEEAKLAQKQKKEEAKRQVTEQKREEAKKQVTEQKEKGAEKQAAEQRGKETLAAKTKESTKSNNSNNSSGSTQEVTKSASAKQGVDKTAQILRTKTGKMYHKRKCGNGNYFATTLNEAQSLGLKPCSKCY